MGQLGLLNYLFEVKTMNVGSNAIIYGVVHYDMQQADEVVQHALSKFNTKKNTVFLGEGGDPNNVYPKGSESEYIYEKLKREFPKLVNDSWDGRDFDVTDPDSYVFSAIQRLTGYNQDLVNAGIYAAMVGQGQDPSEVSRLLNKRGSDILKSFSIQDPKNPSNEDIQIMYDLCFPQDTGKPEQEISKITDAFNEVRDKNLIRKVKKYSSLGYQVIACAGESHLDLLQK